MQSAQAPGRSEPFIWVAEPTGKAGTNGRPHEYPKIRPLHHMQKSIPGGLKF